MKIFAVLLLIVSLILTMIGLLPLMVGYPYSDGPHLAPANMWELILKISFEYYLWLIISGIVLLIISMYILMKGKKIMIS